jgi:hypothetical protein
MILKIKCTLNLSVDLKYILVYQNNGTACIKNVNNCLNTFYLSICLPSYISIKNS